MLLVLAMTVYSMMAEPPSQAGGRDSRPLSDVSATPDGASGVEAAGAIADIVPSLVLAASTVFLASFTATPNGPLPTVAVSVTVLVSPGTPIAALARAGWCQTALRCA